MTYEIYNNKPFHFLKVAKQWYDFERSSLTLSSTLKTSHITFTHQQDFDENGLMYWIGSNAK